MLRAPTINPREGDVAMRYPGGDPENGPAYPQRFTASGWICNDHTWNFGCCAYCGEPDPLGPYLVDRLEAAFLLIGFALIGFMWGVALT